MPQDMFSFLLSGPCLRLVLSWLSHFFNSLCLVLSWLSSHFFNFLSVSVPGLASIISPTPLCLLPLAVCLLLKNVQTLSLFSPYSLTA